MCDLNHIGLEQTLWWRSSEIDVRKEPSTRLVDSRPSVYQPSKTLAASSSISRQPLYGDDLHELE